MKNLFNSVTLPKVGSNAFNLSHDVKMSLKMGGIYPTIVMDCVPGDKIKISTTNMLRFAPLISPVMHKVNVTTHYFFVPNRILWDKWEKWITGETDDNLVVKPYIQWSNEPHENPNFNWTNPVGSVGDYMGLPTGLTVGETRVDAFPIAAYFKIWNEYYRDQNLQEELNVDLPDGDIASSVYDSNPPDPELNGAGTWRRAYTSPPLKRAWNHDYFTSALPFAQKGDAVQIPIGDFSDVPVYLDYDTSFTPGVVLTSGGTDAHGAMQASNGLLNVVGNGNVKIDPNDTLYARTSELQAEAQDINTLRRAFRLQEWLERNARGGTRYTENIMAHFGVRSSDARLQRPEYIGGSKGNMVISEVLSTAETDLPVGALAGHGISVSGGRECSYYCEEHGYIIGIINVQPVTAYMQGIPRHFLRRDRLDYYWPSFAHIGEQEIEIQELYANVPIGERRETFGYVPRYAEYKYLNSRVAGEMRTTLDFWHLARKFEDKPVLNESFIASDPSTRIFAVQEGADHIYAHIYNKITAIRKMPKYGIPSF